MSNRPSHPRWRRRHEGVLRYIIEHPCAKRPEIAAATGYSVDQVSRITCSPDFVRRFAHFRRTYVEPALLKLTMDRLDRLANK